MWGLFETFILYLKKKGKQVPPFLILIILVGAFAIGIYQNIATQPKKRNLVTQENIQKESVQVERKDSKQPEQTPPPQLKTVPKTETVTESVKKYQANEIREETNLLDNQERTHNFTLFSDLLTKSLREKGFEDGFSRTLAEKIRQGLDTAETDVFDLQAIIKSELGENVSDEQTDAVRQLVVKVVGDIADKKYVN